MMTAKRLSPFKAVVLWLQLYFDLQSTNIFLSVHYVPSWMRKKYVVNTNNYNVGVDGVSVAVRVIGFVVSIPVSTFFMVIQC